MNLSRFAVSHLKAILFVTIVLCLVGGILAASFPVSILPDVTFPRAVVIAEAGDTPASTLETTITRPLEEAVATVPGVKRVRSTTQRGASEVSIDFQDGTDMVAAQALINTRIKDVGQDQPVPVQTTVERMNPTVFPVLGLSLQSKSLTQAQLWEMATYQLRPRLSRVPGVARVVVQGGREPEIAVDALPMRLAAYKIGLTEIRDAISATNVMQAAGRFDSEFQGYQTLVSGQIKDIDGLKKVVIATRGGVPIHLSDVALVHDSITDRSTVVTADGRESVLLNIVRQPEANSLTVAAGVQNLATSLRASLPQGTTLSTFYDQSILIGDAVSSVRDAVLIGAALAVFVLLLFLGDWRATVVTGAIIPATVLITFGLMRLVGLSLNLMTLGALAVGIGLVIDDAIVVVENVFRHLSHGEARNVAVQKAAAEISGPMISSTLTTVVVFLPLTLLAGVAGAFFGALAVTLSLALMVSLVLALLVSPSLCASFLRTREGQPEHGRLFEKLINVYERLLGGALKTRFLLPITISLLIIFTGYFASHLGTGFMPTMDEGAFTLDYETPPGTSLVETDRLLGRIETILGETPEVSSYSRRTGAEMGFAITEPNRGDFSVMLKGGSRRPIEDVMAEIRRKIADNVPGVDTDFMMVLQDLIGDLSGSPSPIEIKLFGENGDALNEEAHKIASKLEKVPGAVDVRSGVVESGPAMVVHVDENKAGRVGLTSADVAAQVEIAMQGVIATPIIQNARQLPVRVRLPAEYRNDVSKLSNLPVRSPNGFTLPLGSLATMEKVTGTTEIEREDQRRMVGITAGLESRDLGSVMVDVQKLIAAETLPSGVTCELAGQSQSQSDSFRNLLIVLALAILLVFGVMLFQFSSFTAPLSILLVMPLSLFGVTLSLWLTGTPLNVSSFMGAIMLVGIVVKNGILLLDQAQNLEKTGVPSREAVLEAGRVRLRPILMTTLTAILGLVPLGLGLGAGAEMQKPLAIAVIGGLSFSTLFTLLLLPLVYVALRDIRARVIAPRGSIQSVGGPG